MCCSLVMATLTQVMYSHMAYSKLRDVRAKLYRPDVWKPLGLMLVVVVM